MKTNRLIADSALLGIAFIWGITFVLIQNAISTLPPFSFIFVRFGLSVLFLMVFMCFTHYKKNILSSIFEKNVLKAGSFLGLFLLLAYVFQTFSLLYTTSGKSGFLTGMSVAMVPIFSILILKTKPKPMALTGVFLAVVGLYLLSFVDLTSINIGDLLAFGCAICLGLQIVFTGKYTIKLPSLPLVTVQLATVTIFGGILAFIFEPWQKIINPKILLQNDVAIALIVTSLFATSLAYLGQTYLQKHTTPTRVAIIFAMEPVAALLGDYWWNGIIPGITGFYGCALILLGMILAEVEVNLPKLLRRNSDKNKNTRSSS